MTNDTKERVNKLLEEVSHGHNSSFNELHSIMYPNMYNFLKLHSNDEELIKDSISTTFSLIIKKSREKLFFVNCYSWLLSVAKNVLMNSSRKSSHEVSLDKLEETSQIAYTQDDQLIDKLTINSLVEKLDTRDREIFNLRFCFGYEYSEIIKTLKISKSTLGRRINHILDYMRKNLVDED